MAATQPITAKTQEPMKAPFAINEANLPRGFPTPGPVGTVTVKNYPAYRAAVVREDNGQGEQAQQNSMFSVLFKHIKKNDIPMTAPVEMDEPAAPLSSGQILKAFELEKDRYVVFQPSEIAALKPRTSSELAIDEFVRLAQVAGRARSLVVIRATRPDGVE